MEAPSLRHFLTSACGERLSDTEVASLCEAWAAEYADVDGVEALRGFVRWLFQGVEDAVALSPRAPEKSGVPLSEFMNIVVEEKWLAVRRERHGTWERPNMYDLVEKFIKPKTEKNRVAYAELLDPMEPHVFVSHWWGEEFVAFVRTLDNFDKLKLAGSPEQTVFWVCSFANRQWQVNLGETLQESPFERALTAESCTHVLMVLDRNATPLRRIWCLYEVLRTHALKKDFHMGTENGMLTVGGEPQGRVRTDLLDLTRKVIQIDASTATASRETDRQMIVKEVDEVAGVEQFGIHIMSLLKDAFVSRGGKQLGADDSTLKPKLMILDLKRQLLVTFQGRSKLHVAAQKGDIQQVQSLLSVGDPQERHTLCSAANGKGQLPLHLAACFSRSSEVIDALCKAAPTQVNAGDDFGLTPLMLAALNGRHECMLALLEHRAQVDAHPPIRQKGVGIMEDFRSPMVLAGLSGSVECLKLLLGEGMQIRQEALMLLCTAGHVDALSVLLPYADWAVLNEPFRKGAPSVLFISSGMGNFEATKLLLEAKAEVNKACMGNNSTPVFAAMGQGHLDIVKLLVSHEADPFVVTTEGDSPLTVAAGGGYTVGVEFLLSLRADINQVNGEKLYSPLHVAAEWARDLTVSLLVQLRAEVNMTNREGSTPLHNAASFNYVSTLRCLLQLRADPSIKDVEGRTAAELAREEDNDDAYDFLSLPLSISCYEHTELA